MNLQDFFSIVQLGVGVHAGTAILQLTGEFGVAPVERRLAALHRWIAKERERGFKLEREVERLSLIEVDLILFKSKYDRVYRRSVNWTFGCGALLTLALAAMSFAAQYEVNVYLGLMIVTFSIAPAPLIFGNLLRVSSGSLRRIKKRLTTMEKGVRSPDPNV